jgi:hypothetical protein
MLSPVLRLLQGDGDFELDPFATGAGPGLGDFDLIEIGRGGIGFLKTIHAVE